MAIASRQNPAAARQSSPSSSIAYGFSQAAAVAVVSMASILPRRILFLPHSAGLDLQKMPTAPEMDLDIVDLKFDSFHDFSVKLRHLPLSRIGAGLANLGNTCFINAVLQCLTYTPPLAAYLQTGSHRRSCQTVGFCAMCALESHVKEALTSHGRTVSPNILVKNLKCISRSFQMWRQEDAHEYMRYLIEALQKSCPQEVYGGKSFIHSVFGGQLRSQVKCTQCSHCSNKYDPFLDLSLEVVEADSLQTALAHFTTIEVLDGENKYQCSQCKTKVRALKQFTIDKAPPILTIQFKRFSSLDGFGGKIDKKIHFDRVLDLKPFVNEEEDDHYSYSLYAVLVHSGWSVNSGHYYCFVRTGTDTWHLMDDNRVSEVSESTVLEQKAYILLYMRNSVACKSENTNYSHDVSSSSTSSDADSDDSDSEEQSDTDETSSSTSSIEIDGRLDSYKDTETSISSGENMSNSFLGTCLSGENNNDESSSDFSDDRHHICSNSISEFSERTDKLEDQQMNSNKCQLPLVLSTMGDSSKCKDLCSPHKEMLDGLRLPVSESCSREVKPSPNRTSSPIVRTSIFGSAGSLFSICADLLLGSCIGSSL